MSDQVTYRTGVLATSALAGPIFTSVLTLGSLFIDGAPVESVGAVPFLLLVVGVISLPFGFALSVGPNLVGAMLLAWAGRGNQAARLPVVWLLTGSLAAGGFAFATIDGGAHAVALFAATGAVCALIARRHTRWF